MCLGAALTLFIHKTLLDESAMIAASAISGSHHSRVCMTHTWPFLTAGGTTWT